MVWPFTDADARPAAGPPDRAGWRAVSARRPRVCGRLLCDARAALRRGGRVRQRDPGGPGGEGAALGAP